jgi:hypothetical protein
VTYGGTDDSEAVTVGCEDGSRFIIDVRAKL